MDKELLCETGLEDTCSALYLQTTENIQVNNDAEFWTEVTKIPWFSSSKLCSLFTEKKENTKLAIPSLSRGQQMLFSNTESVYRSLHFGVISNW